MNEGARDANDWNWRRSVLEELRAIRAALAPKKVESGSEKPTEIIVHYWDGSRPHLAYDGGQCCFEPPATVFKRLTVVRYHDADECDRLHDGCRQNPI